MIDLTKRLTALAETSSFISFRLQNSRAHSKQIPENYSMTATRRLMLQIADKLRERHNALAIFTGESLGQVASQTLESMYAINAVTSTPVCAL
ncbi:hypothetical protein PO124_09680 [Bacillus licheniformis]|nr:hypothetical protein [Bacillus licheniformis]